ncbi:hypothetical protein [Ileibacterium valens]|nr:hypothetical protein [Ileibacterium valens]
MANANRIMAELKTNSYQSFSLRFFNGRVQVWIITMGFLAAAI